MFQILNPKSKVSKTYWVQVEGEVSEEAMAKLASGVKIKIKTGKYHHTQPCEVFKIKEPDLPERNPPIRFRKSIPTSWASITISEGKNRQVRKMFAKVEFPVLRLVRYSIGEITINGMNIGDVKEVDL